MLTAYSPLGVHVTPKKTLPWHTVKTIVRPDGVTVIRRALLLAPGDTPFVAPGLGVVRNSDQGRLFVVDELPDGSHVEHLLTPGLDPL